MGDFYWRTEQKESFDELCNMVAKGQMVCLTGAGVSKKMLNENGDEEKELPDWQELLEGIYGRMQNVKGIDLEDEKETIDELLSTEDKSLLKELKKVLEKTEKSTADDNDRETIKRVLERNLVSSASADSGERLIAVASLLHNMNSTVFKETLLDIVKTDKKAKSKTHDAIADLNPLGIMTYNYDTGHEAAWKERKVKFDVIVPADREKIRSMIRDGFEEKKFILKAHGSTEKKESIVLTSESYSDLFTTYSYYKTLVQDILMNHQLLIVGFGMADPDFDRMIRDLFTTFGGPIQKHVVIAHESTKSRKDLLYSHNYGFQYLYVKKFTDIPLILRDCTEYVGSYVDEILKDIVIYGKKGIEKRSEAHKKLRNLNNVAKNIAAKELMERITDLTNEIQDSSAVTPGNHKVFELSEYVYSLGCLLDPKSDVDGKRKQFLIDNVILSCHVPKVVAHALYQIKDYLKKGDLNHIRKWRRIFENDQYFGKYGFEDGELNFDTGSSKKILRNEVYCGFLDALVQSKFYKFENEDD